MLVIRIICHKHDTILSIFMLLMQNYINNHHVIMLNEQISILNADTFMLILRDTNHDKFSGNVNLPSKFQHLIEIKT